MLQTPDFIPLPLLTRPARFLAFLARRSSAVADPPLPRGSPALAVPRGSGLPLLSNYAHYSVLCSLDIEVDTEHMGRPMDPIGLHRCSAAPETPTEPLTTSAGRWTTAPGARKAVAPLISCPGPHKNRALHSGNLKSSVNFFFALGSHELFSRSSSVNYIAVFLSLCTEDSIYPSELAPISL